MKFLFLSKYKFILLIMVTISIFLEGCQNHLVIPQNKNILLITHYKKPQISFYDLKSEKVIETKNTGFTIKTIGRLSDNRFLFTKVNEDGLFILNMKTGKVTKMSEIGKGISTIVPVPELHLCFLADSETNQIYYYDMRKNRITNKVSTGNSPISIAVDMEKELLYVANVKSASISTISIPDHKVINSYKVVDRPSAIFFDGSAIWVAAHGPYGKLNNELFIYDATTGKEIKKLKVGLMPVGFFHSNSNSFLYVICHGSNEVYQINLKNDSIKPPIAVSENPYYINGDKNNIYVTSLDGNTLSIINQQSFTLKKQIPVQDGPYIIYPR